MCGRYTLTEVDPHKIASRFGDFDEHGIEPGTLGRFNVCPTETIVTLDAEGPRALRWGLVPSYAKQVGKGPALINARVESVASKAPFAKLLARPERRCLVLADGWYEWQVAPGGKQPWFIRMKDARPFAFAGLWERWKDPASGAQLESCTIVTTDAAESVRKIHERMPVVLAEADWDRWLDTAFSDTDKLSELLRPYDPKSLEAWKVGREVNAPKNQGPELIAAAD